MKTRIAIAAIALAGFAAAANADVTYSGTGGNLPDSATTSFDIIVPSGDGPIGTVSNVTMNLTHSFVGDLRISLVHVDTGTTVVLMDRPGVPASTFGNGDNFAGTYTFVTDMLAPVFPENGTENGVVAPGSYQSASSLAAFDGQDSAGTWRLIFEDLAGGDSGALRTWSFTTSQVPTPGAAALVGLGGVAFLRRRRHQA